jgi:hypothetical protein
MCTRVSFWTMTFKGRACARMLTMAVTSVASRCQELHCFTACCHHSHHAPLSSTILLNRISLFTRLQGWFAPRTRLDAVARRPSVRVPVFFARTQRCSLCFHTYFCEIVQLTSCVSINSSFFHRSERLPSSAGTTGCGTTTSPRKPRPCLPRARSVKAMAFL